MRSRRDSNGKRPAWPGIPVAVALSLATILVSLAYPPTLLADMAGATLDITVADVRNDRGHIRLAVCTRQTFLGTNCPYIASAPAQTGSVKLSVENVAPGIYAIQAFHDEDDSGHIKLSLLGIPEEGVGFSKDAPIRIGAPRFSDAAFQLTPSGGQLVLRLRHFE